MSKVNADITLLLNTMMEEMKALKTSIDEMKTNIHELQEDNASAAVNAESMYKTLNAKFDLFKNLESDSRETIRQQSAAGTRKLTRPVFFKKLFIEDRMKYINILYTQEEIDIVMQDKEVTSKKKEDDRISKLATLIYTKHIKGNNPEGRASAFASIYEQSLTN